MTAPRPKCVACGKPYGSRSTTSNKVLWPVGEPMPAYRGNGIVVKTTKLGATATRETVRGVTALSVNPEIRARQEAQIARAPVESFQVAYRDVWDGVTWFKPYEPFCTLRCALAYAQAAFKATGVKRKLAVALVGLAALAAASAAPAPARAGGVLLCNEYGCRSSPYFPPPVVAVSPPVVYVPASPGPQRQEVFREGFGAYAMPGGIFYGDGPPIDQRGPPMRSGDFSRSPYSPPRQTHQRAPYGLPGPEVSARSPVSRGAKVSGDGKVQREIEADIMAFCGAPDHSAEPFCVKLGDYLATHPEARPQ